MGTLLSLLVSNMNVVFELWFLQKWYDQILLLFNTVSLHFCKIVPNVYITNFGSFRRSLYLRELVGMIISTCKGTYLHCQFQSAAGQTSTSES